MCAAHPNYTIHNLYLITKPGLTVFHKIVGSVETAHELVGGAFTGIGNLTQGMGFGEVHTMVTDIYLVATCSGNFINGILVVDRDANVNLVEECITDTVNLFENHYRKELERWDGKLSTFKDFPEFIYKHVINQFDESMKALAYQTAHNLWKHELKSAEIIHKAGIDLGKVFPPIFTSLSITGDKQFQFGTSFQNAKTEPFLPKNIFRKGYWAKFVGDIDTKVSLEEKDLEQLKSCSYSVNPFMLQLWGVRGETTMRSPQLRRKNVYVLDRYIYFQEKAQEILENPPQGYVQDEIVFILDVMARIYFLHKNQVERGLVSTVSPQNLLAAILEKMGLPQEKTIHVMDLAEKHMRITRAFQDAVGTERELEFLRDVTNSDYDINSYFSDVDSFNLMLKSLHKLREKYVEIEPLLKSHDAKFVSNLEKYLKGLKKSLKFMGISDLASSMPKTVDDPGKIPKVYDVFCGIYDYLVEIWGKIQSISDNIGLQILESLPIQLHSMRGIERGLDLLQQYVKQANVVLWEN